MRLREFISEAKSMVASVEHNGTSYKDVRVWVSPTASDLAALLGRLGALRGVITNHEIVVWDAKESTHQHVIDALDTLLGHFTTEDTFFVTQTNETHDWWHDTPVSEFTNGAVRLYAGKLQLSPPMRAKFERLFKGFVPSNPAGRA